jgi:hypothetical protein
MAKRNTGQFTSTIYIDNSNYDRLASGEMGLRTGQWVKFAWCHNRSRYVGSRHGIIYAAHYPNTSNERVRGMADSFRDDDRSERRRRRGVVIS